MTTTVVLGGDLEQIKIDGFPELLTEIDGDASLVVPADGSAELVTETDGDADLLQVLDGQASVVMAIREGAYPTYTGEVEITPNQSEQVLPTSETSVMSNIIIKPIPQNYGLITWNGSTITVS